MEGYVEKKTRSEIWRSENSGERQKGRILICDIPMVTCAVKIEKIQVLFY
jgi:hypothetical protein